jgi:hypothetical protein
VRWRSLLLIFAAVTAFYWKLTLTRQYAFLESFDLANQVLPWLQVQVNAIHHGQVALWTPYEWMGQPLLGQMQPGVFSPFTWLLALTPLRDGFLQFHWVNWWFIAIHLAAAWFMWAMLRDLGVREAAAIAGGLLYSCIGFYGSTDWPQVLASAIWAPLVFLFLFRTLRGQKPLASSCMAGVFTGMAWLSGYFASAYYLTLAGLAVFATALWKTEGPSGRKLRLFAAYGIVLAAVSAPQVLPAAEYGRYAIRWTKTGPLRWNQRVGLAEHFDSGMRGADLAHLVIPGADLHAEPFTGAIALGLAGLGLAGLSTPGSPWRLERIALAGLAVGSLLFAMAGSLFLYGALYVLVPMLEKSRAPVSALSVFHFAVAALAGVGVDRLLSAEFRRAAGTLAKGMVWFGGALITVVTIFGYLPPVENAVFVSRDSRLYPIALAALLFGGVCFAFLRGITGLRTTAVLVAFFALMEQGQMAGYSWVPASEPGRNVLLPLMGNTRDLADFLRPRQPDRVEIKRDDGMMFTFGDWFGIHAVEALSASMLSETMDLGWWPDRSTRLFGVRYTIAKNPTRANQRELFRGKAGFAIFENPDTLPRVWTIHRLIPAASDKEAADLTRDGTFDLAQEAVIQDSLEPLETCAGPDSVRAMRFGLNRVSADVNMACRGILMVADNWFPGWVAAVDGHSVQIERMDGGIRGVAVSAGQHRVEMKYRPWSAFGGMAAMLAGFLMTSVAYRT